METKDPRIIVQIIRAKDLIACDKRSGKSDPICRVQCGTEELQTNVIHETINPEWNSSELVFGSCQNVVEILEKGFLHVLVEDYDDNVHGEVVYSNLGRVSIPVIGLIEEEQRRIPV